jgi:hypothetical protein
MQKNRLAVNWFEQTEHKRKLLVGGTIIICLAMLALTTRRYNVSYDSFWHLQTGLDWLRNGLSPWRDHFSFTFNGKEIINPPYLFEILLGWLVSQFGLEPGFQLYKFAGFLLVFGLVVFFLRKLRAPVVVYLLVLPLLVVLLQIRSIVRPELISYSFSVLAVMLYYRARKRMSVTNMLPMVVLMLVWSNYHSPIFGYIIFFGYFVDIALQQINDRAPFSAWLQWLGWGVAVVAVGFLTPGLNHPLVHLLFFSPEWKHLIQEYQSAVLYRELAAIYALITVALVTLILSLRNRQFGLLFVCTLLIFFAVDMARLVTPSGIVILCIFAWMVSEIDLAHQLQRLPHSLSLVIGGSVMALYVLSLASSVKVARSYMVENRTSGFMFPKDVADYMVDQDISGRIFNAYNAGGYLIYRLSPDSQVYIDGRTDILYPLDHYYRHMDAEKSPDILRAEIEKYEIDLAVLENKQSNFSVVRDTETLGLDYVGVRFSLFRKDNPNFPVFGALLAHPACWNPDMSSALEMEQTRANSILPGNSMLLPFMQFVIDYSKTDNRATFLMALEEGSQWTDPKLRFAGYQALIQNLDSIAFELLAGIKKKEFGDYLGGALAKARLGEWKAAEQTLDLGTRVSWSEKTSEIEILHGLLVHIRQNFTLEIIDDAYVDRLAKDVGASSDSASSSVPDIHSFCPDS